ncbi:MAG TPA: aspartyl protease family protein [Caulobacteraceae bacterium]
MKMRALLLAFVVLAGAVFGRPALADCKLSKLPDLQVTMRGPRALVHTTIDGADGLFVVDTGAFFSSATAAAVARFNLTEEPAPFGMYVTGIGHGETQISVATVKNFVFDGVPLHRIDFIVLDRRLGEEVDGSIGENILGAPDVEYDLGNGAIRLFQSSGCRNSDLAYWATNQTDSVVDNDAEGKLEPPKAFATLNGVRIRVVFDTGAPRSLLSTSAAARAGVKPSDPGVVRTGYTGGVAANSQLSTWRGQFASFKLGGEEIRNTPLQFGDIALQGADMILGADFFLSHRVFVANSQHRIYFTYNGGRVFNLDAAPELAPDEIPEAAAAPPPAGAQPPAPAPPAATDPNAPRDASGYARRGEAYAARRDYPNAISDLTHAIALAPDNADYVYQRGRFELSNRQLLLAKADLDQAIKLKPDNVLALLTRALMYGAMRQPAEARADLEAASRIADKQPAARLEVAAAYAGMRMFKEAVTQLDQWIAENPHAERMAGGLNERCWARAQLGVDLDKALIDCNAALRLSPGDPSFLDSRGLVELRMGNFDKSIGDYDEALKLRPSEAWSLYGRGLAELRKGLTAPGQADIKAATALNPRLSDEAKAAGLEPPPNAL